MTDWQELAEALGDIPSTTNPTERRQKSRDFYWYSPILKQQLDTVVADLIVSPRNEADVVRALATCHARQVPVTVRGCGTGNYGQAMPIQGGVVLDVSGMTAIKWIRQGSIRAEAGLKIGELERATKAQSGQELRFHPSTLKTASIGGFVTGGSSGIGSITWGLLRDRGNIIAARVVTMEAEPRVLELRGDDVQKINHAYGTNGVVTEVEVPLTAAMDWADVMVAFDDFMEAARFSQALGDEVGIAKKLVTTVADPIGQDYFRPLKGVIPERGHLVLAMIAGHSLEAFEALLGEWPGEVVYKRTAEELVAKTPLYEFSWNHSTLQALKVDRSITYLQILFPPPNHLALVEEVVAAYGDELPMHLEFIRFDGPIACFGLPIVRYKSEERMMEVIRDLEARGCPVFNPHDFTLEGGGMKMVDDVQLAFKREADPAGLMNPGKMLAWDNPDYDAAAHHTYLYPALSGGR